jgi:hypothetical protein
MWLALLDRNWTSDRLAKHGLRDDASCTLCDQDAEMIDHLLVNCIFSLEAWFKLLGRRGWQNLCPIREASFVQWWLRARKRVSKRRREVFDSTVTVGTWNLWCRCNDGVFSGAHLMVAATATKEWEELELWCRVRLVDRSRLHEM